METGIHRFVGDKKFYRRVLAIAVPIMVQNGITNFVSLLDNIMVGQVGTEEMSGVAIVNQLIFIFFLCIFGGLSGAGIFTAQYFGQRDDEGIRHTFRYKVWLGAIITVVAIVIFLFWGKNLIGLYLNDSTSVGNVEEALHHGMTYLHIIMFGLPAIALTNVYSGTMRDCGRTKAPMVAGICAVIVNLGLDYLLIFGEFGFPKLGVAGAALATVIARYIEMLIVIIWCHIKSSIYTYMKGVYRTLLVPRSMVKEFFRKGFPILINETLWSSGMATLTQCYSTRGMEVIAALNISTTLFNLLNVVFIAMGDAIAIIVGQLLGAGKMEEAKSTDTKIIFFAFIMGLFVAGGLVAGSFFFPNMYNTSGTVRELATRFILIQAIFTPQIPLLHTSYFTLRAGGKTIQTFIFDSAFLWVISVPTALALSRFTGIHVLWIFTIINMIDILKTSYGLYLVRKNTWMNTITI